MMPMHGYGECDDGLDGGGGGGGDDGRMRHIARRLMLMVTCSLESIARQVRTATQSIERTPTCFSKSAKLFSSKDAYSALTSSATILEQSRQKENAETNR